ncbi:hypothetical protein FGB62_336g024 [Gracilaria domingensis]|nr:hypothetical protein FGB62_336g024 [Gracilaria domingensis]
MSVNAAPRRTIGKKAPRKTSTNRVRSAPSSSSSPIPRACICFPPPRAPSSSHAAPPADRSQRHVDAISTPPSTAPRNEAAPTARRGTGAASFGASSSRRHSGHGATSASIVSSAAAGAGSAAHSTQKKVDVSYVGETDTGSHWVKVVISKHYPVAILCPCGCKRLVKVGKYGYMVPEGSTKCPHCKGGGDNEFTSRKEFLTHMASKACRTSRRVVVSEEKPKEKLGKLLCRQIDGRKYEVLVDKKLNFLCKHCEKTTNYHERYNHCVKCWLVKNKVKPIPYTVREINNARDGEEDEEVLVGSDGHEDMEGEASDTISLSC